MKKYNLLIIFIFFVTLCIVLSAPTPVLAKAWEGANIAILNAKLEVTEYAQKLGYTCVIDFDVLDNLTTVEDINIEQERLINMIDAYINNLQLTASEFDLWVLGTKSINNLTTGDFAELTNQKEYYLSLSEAAKSYVQEYTTLLFKINYIIHLAKEQFLTLQESLPESLETLEEDIVNKVLTLRHLYTTFDLAQLNLDIDKFLILESAVNHLQKQQSDKADSENVSLLIDSLPQVILLEQLEIVESIREAYDALSAEGQALVLNYSVLISAELRLSELLLSKHKAEDFEALLDTISAEITLEHKAEIANIRHNYNLLSEEEKGFVLNLIKLIEAEEQIMTLETAQIISNDIILAIDLLLDVTLSDDQYIRDLRAAYDNLSVDAKRFVSNYAILQNAEQRIIQLNIARQVGLDFEEIVEGILNIMSDVDQEDEYSLQNAGRQITSIKEQYESLSVDAQSFVKNALIIEDALESIEALKDLYYANIVISKIDMLDDQFFEEDIFWIESVRIAYDTLTDSAKLLVHNYKDLIMLEKAKEIYENCIQSAITVDNAILSIGIFEYSKKEDIEDVRVLYELLSANAKSKVTKLPILIELEQELEYAVQQKEIAKAVVLVIYSLPYTITLQEESEIVSAREAYQDLTHTARAFVYNYEILERAETRILALKYNVTKSQEIRDLIESIPPIIQQAKQYIQLARGEYDNASAEVKGLVTNYYKLVEAEIALDNYYSEERVAEVVGIIVSLPDTSEIVIATKLQITTAREQYEQLNEGEKRKVDNYPALVFAEQRIIELEYQWQRGEEVGELIDSLPDLATLEHKDQVYNVYEKYLSLEQWVIGYVNNIVKLVALVQEMEVWEQIHGNANKVINLIRDLPNTVGYEDRTAVQDTYSEYTALNARERIIVYDSGEYAKLTKLLNRINALATAKQKAEEVDTKILELPLYPSLLDEQAIRLVEGELNALDLDAKSFVSNSGLLNIIILRLQKERDCVLASAVDNLILGLPEVMDSSYDIELKNVRDAYDSLSEYQKLFVLEYPILVDCETQMRELYRLSKIKASDLDISCLYLANKAITQSDAALITSLRELYNSFEEYTKGFVLNEGLLVHAEQQLEALVLAQVTARGWDELVDSMPDILKIEDYDWVVGVLNDYDNLSDIEKDYVTRYSEVVAAKQYILGLQADLASGEVVQRIDNIPTNIVLSDKEYIEDIRQAYELLAQKESVYNYLLLVNAELRIAKIFQNTQKAGQINNKIHELYAQDKDTIMQVYYEYLSADIEVKGLVDYALLESIMQQSGVIDTLVIRALEIREGIEKVKEITLSSQDLLTTLRSDYESLSEYAQSFVDNIPLLVEYEECYASMVSAKQEALFVSQLIADLEMITKDSGEILDNLNNAYQNLSDIAKNMVDNYSQLEKANQEYLDLIHKQSAREFDALVCALPSQITLESLFEIQAARTLYNDLDEIARTYTTQLVLLEIAERELSLLDIVYQRESEVIRLIELIPQEITLEDSLTVKDARLAYNSLSNDSKESVRLSLYISILTAAETALEEEYENYIRASQVIYRITKLPVVIVWECTGEVRDINAIYNLLSEQEKRYVVNINVLIEAIAVIADLEEAFGEAQEVVALIEALPEGVTLADSEIISNARTSYNLLSKEAKAFVYNYDSLTARENQLFVLQRESLVQEVINLIDSIDTVTLENIIEAREYYNNLDPTHKTAVINYYKLVEAEQIYIDYVGGLKADIIINQIAQLPLCITIAERETVAEIRQGYESLTEGEKLKVSNIYKLEEAELRIEKILDNIRLAEEWDAQVRALLPIEQLSISRQQEIEQIKESYIQMNTEVKAFVQMYDTFVQIEIHISAEIMRITAEVNVVRLAINEIPSINNLVIRDADKVNSARVLYDALEETAKAMVDNYEVLNTAELQIFRLQKYSDFNSSVSRIDYRDKEWTTILEYVETFIDELFAARDFAEIELAYQNIASKVQLLKTDLEHSKLQAIEDITNFASSIEYSEPLDFSAVEEATNLYQVALAVDLISDEISMHRQIQINDAIENTIYEIGNFIVGIVEEYANLMEITLEEEFDITSPEAKYSDFERYLIQAFDKDSVELIILLHKKAAVQLMFAENERVMSDILDKCISDIALINTLDTDRAKNDVEKAKQLAAEELRELLKDSNKTNYTASNWSELQVTVLSALYALEHTQSLQEINQLLSGTEKTLNTIEKGNFDWVIWLVVVVLAISSVGFVVVLTVSVIRLKKR